MMEYIMEMNYDVWGILICAICTTVLSPTFPNDCTTSALKFLGINGNI